MTITLPPQLAVPVSYAVRTGRYPSALRMILEALTLLSERDLAACGQPSISTAGADDTLDAEAVLAEIEQQLAEANAAVATTARPITTNALYRWVSDSLDYLDLGNAAYARELLVALRDRLAALDRHEREQHEANLTDEDRRKFAEGEALLAQDLSEHILMTDVVRCEPWPMDQRPIYPSNYPPTLVDLDTALKARMDDIALAEGRSRDTVISRALWEYVYARDERVQE